MYVPCPLCVGSCLRNAPNNGKRPHLTPSFCPSAGQFPSRRVFNSAISAREEPPNFRLSSAELRLRPRMLAKKTGWDLKDQQQVVHKLRRVGCVHPRPLQASGSRFWGGPVQLDSTGGALASHGWVSGNVRDGQTSTGGECTELPKGRRSE